MLLASILSGCDRDEPRSPDTGTPDPGTPSTDIQISGRERIGWNQPASDAFELLLFEYALYVDGTRIPLTGVRCSSVATETGFECSAPLPSLSPGRHTLELASFIADLVGTVESSRSEGLRVNMTGAAVRAAFNPLPVSTVDGANLVLEHVTDGLNEPVDIAVADAGTMLVAERAGMVRLVSNGTLAAQPALDVSDEITSPAAGVLGLALDPRFSQTGLLYLLYAIDSGRDGFDVVLARFRGVNGRFGERAVLMTRSQADPPAGALRIGADGKLYVGVEREVLRLNADATTPDDHVPISPVYSADHPAPRAFDWQPRTSDLWVIDAVDGSAGRLSALGETPTARRAVPRVAYTLPQGTGASSAIFYRGDAIPAFRGDLFVAATSARELMRLRFDPRNITSITSVERLLKDQIGPVRVVAQASDGGLYVASDTAMYRLRP